MMSYELNYQLNNYIMKKTNATRVNVMNIRDCNKLSDPPIPYYVISGELVFVLSGKISDIFITTFSHECYKTDELFEMIENGDKLK